MDLTIYPRKLSGEINIIPSKSQAHRLLICAAFSDGPTSLLCSETNQDIEATVCCLRTLGATINRTDDGYYILPITEVPIKASLDCRESGSTLRFILPIVCALGVDATITMSGRLPNRPLSPLWEELGRMGCQLFRRTENQICTRGKLMCGKYAIAGNVSSQYITGLLFALSLLDGTSTLTVNGSLESKPYVDMTLDALSMFGVKTDGKILHGMRRFQTPGNVCVEGDWSNGAFFLVANALGSNITVNGLDLFSTQGDKAIEKLIKDATTNACVSVADIPDLLPILSVYYAARSGVHFTDIERLRLKESDRVQTVTSMLNAFGIRVVSTEHEMSVHCRKFSGCVVNAYNDHRIAMSAAIAATIADGPVTILGAECVAKSYPSFWDEYKRLGGYYEQYIR